MRFLSATLSLALVLSGGPAWSDPVSFGPRPLFLLGQMDDGPLKSRLAACKDQAPRRSAFSVAHRGAPLMFPEHTVESYSAAARMGAGIVECDVTFTADLQLVCRHAQDDLHATTNILATPLAEKCSEPFRPATAASPASAECRSSDLTLAEFRSLSGKMDAADPTATDVAAYIAATPSWQTDLYAAAGGTLVTHAESIALLRDLGVKFMPELKAPVVEMPFNGLTQEMYAQALIDDYKAAGIPPSDVWVQSFHLADLLYWLKYEPEFGAQAVLLDGRYTQDGFDPMTPDTWKPTMAEAAAMGVRYIGPPIWMLLTLEGDEIVATPYAREAKAAGLEIVPWALERSGPLAHSHGAWFLQSISGTIDDDGDVYRVLDALAHKVGVAGVFSDWPATVTYFANCMGL